MDIVQRLRDRLKKPDDEQTALSRLMPLIVPASYFEHDFPAPHEILPEADFALTAVILDDQQTMVYLGKDRAARWKAQGINWKAKAIENLLAADKGQPVTHVKPKEEGGLQWAAMMNADGLGTSRVLCSEVLREMFPEGYWIAIPERSMGIAVSKKLTADENSEVVALINNCFQKGTIPNSPKLFEPQELGG